ncbi:uncharacterized protein BJ212DRAFT_1302509 [Suillus subaureus]|uniref:Uncharacterized protein n=1 Tax=Suillus subaureus TaxID=48587 RepID=A0A9P7E2X1_9AGAM|nr:uncharacterized protein BJ212DRAFT_1302509 [Suillus subaureus]KAG1809678.1 hypothetical protein BJ212DRAFT_1302509 [Suillus subaureus]
MSVRLQVPPIPLSRFRRLRPPSDSSTYQDIVEVVILLEKVCLLPLILPSQISNPSIQGLTRQRLQHIEQTLYQLSERRQRLGHPEQSPNEDTHWSGPVLWMVYGNDFESCARYVTRQFNDWGYFDVQHPQELSEICTSLANKRAGTSVDILKTLAGRPKTWLKACFSKQLQDYTWTHTNNFSALVGSFILNMNEELHHSLMKHSSCCHILRNVRVLAFRWQHTRTPGKALLLRSPDQPMIPSQGYPGVGNKGRKTNTNNRSRTAKEES